MFSGDWFVNNVNGDNGGNERADRVSSRFDRWSGALRNRQCVVEIADNEQRRGQCEHGE